MKWIRDLWLGLLIIACTSNSRPWVWFNLRNPRHATPEQIRQLSDGMRGMINAATRE